MIEFQKGIGRAIFLGNNVVSGDYEELYDEANNILEYLNNHYPEQFVIIKEVSDVLHQIYIKRNQESNL